MNIFEKMAAITAELQTVAKNLTVPSGGGKGYKAVSERDIIDAVKPLETAHGVYSYPVSREILESAMLENEKEYNGKVSKSTTFFSRIKTVYRFVNCEKPDEWIEMTTFAEGIDTADKGSGKAMTYADKYALMKAYKISTGDDPDQEASVETNYTARNEKKKPLGNICEMCGHVITDAPTKDGAMMSVENVMEMSQRIFGRRLCHNCMVICRGSKQN